MQVLSRHFVKNIIGQTLVDIKICHTCFPDNYTSHYRKKGEDMYDEILFIFENGYQLRISSDIDYMVLSEQPSWLKMQKFSKDYWNSFSRYNEEENKPSFSELIANSVPKENSNLQIITKLIYGLDLDIGFDCNNTNSSLWIAESMNWVPNIFYFLEAIIYSKETEIFFYCDEEGRDSFLYVQTINDKKIRFIHLSDKRYIGEHILNDFNIKQDVIIDKREFVEKFYSAIKKAVATVTIDELNEEGWGHLLNDEYELLKKGSKIIEIFLEVNN